MGVNSIESDNSNFIFEDDNLSFYYGFKTNKYEEVEINKSYDKKSYLEDEKNIKVEELNNKLEKKIRITVSFEWDQGGNNVYVTGNFCNWKQFFLMRKEKNVKF